jgi:hypothetical protein
VARKEKLSITRLVNRTLQTGLQESRASARRPRYREKTYSMGAPKLDLDRALALAVDLEKEEVLRKMPLRK